MSVLRLDTIEGCRLSYGTKGWSVSRGAYISGLTGAGLAQLTEAKAALEAAGCTIGQAFPDGALSACKLLNVRVESMAKGVIHFTLEYERPTSTSMPQLGETQIEVGASCTQQQTNRYHNGSAWADISLSYTYPATFPENSAIAGTTKSVSAFVNRYVPEVPLSFSKIVTISAQDLFLLSQNYVGYVNSALWYSGAAETWLCTSIRGRSQDGGSSFVVTYTFLYRYETWKERAVFVDAYTGKPPADVIEGVGKKWCTEYLMKDFSALGL
jgi:hypothetical protein